MNEKKQEYTKCIRCGRRLKSDEAKARGYGKTCWEKRIKDNQMHLFN